MHAARTPTHNIMIINTITSTLHIFAPGLLFEPNPHGLHKFFFSNPSSSPNVFAGHWVQSCLDVIFNLSEYVPFGHGFGFCFMSFALQNLPAGHILHLPVSSIHEPFKHLPLPFFFFGGGLPLEGDGAKDCGALVVTGAGAGAVVVAAAAVVVDAAMVVDAAVVVVVDAAVVVVVDAAVVVGECAAVVDATVVDPTMVDVAVVDVVVVSAAVVGAADVVVVCADDVVGAAVVDADVVVVCADVKLKHHVNTIANITNKHFIF